MRVGQSVIFSQPRGDRGATMEKGEVQIFSLIATIISFLSRNSKIIEPCWALITVIN